MNSSIEDLIYYQKNPILIDTYIIYIEKYNLQKNEIEVLVTNSLNNDRTRSTFNVEQFDALLSIYEAKSRLERDLKLDEESLDLGNLNEDEEV